MLSDPGTFHELRDPDQMSTAIVGASGAIGAALARRIHARGGTPWLVGRSVDKLRALSDELALSDAQMARLDALNDPRRGTAASVAEHLKIIAAKEYVKDRGSDGKT